MLCLIAGSLPNAAHTEKAYSNDNIIKVRL